MVEAFAALLAHTDIPHKVGAVCLEQHSDGLLVRTAVNSGDQTERVNNVRKITEALESCAEGLYVCLHASAMLTSRTEKDEEPFFDAIISACQKRLLTRLRSSHAKSHWKVGRPTIASKLCEGLTLLDKYGAVHPQLMDLKSQTALLGKRLVELDCVSPNNAQSEAGLQSLKNILFSVGQISASIDIGTILRLIPKNLPSWSEQDNQSLIRVLSSLYQYQQAARYLLRRASREPYFVASAEKKFPIKCLMLD